MENHTIQELTKVVQEFCEERDWDQFHNPKDLAIGISTEANELLDIFRFKSDEQMKELFDNDKSRGHIEEEIADTLFFVLRFAQMNNLDLGQCLKKKIEMNNQKYPVDKIKGKNLKYTDL
ncbi:MAG TPA: nucleotide pyrophosphohydrolase [Candidatus Merdenecus merdavium]|nr:nucleotide pyrophosphohydrolase [Candidatus Merdenecus merdavium]